MKILVESTTKVVELNGVRMRVWEGNTENGIPVHVYIARVAVDARYDCQEFDADLSPTRTPSAVVAALPSRSIL